jgi:hypothetical protein
MDTWEVPMVAFHEQANILTPYGTGYVTSAMGISFIEVDGSGTFMPYAQDVTGVQVALTATTSALATAQGFNSNTSTEGLFAFKGAANGYEPWEWYDVNDPYYSSASIVSDDLNPYHSETRGKAYIDTIMGYYSPRAAVVLGLEEALSEMGIDQSVQDLAVAGSVSVFPNPSASDVLIQADNMIETVELYSMEGSLVNRVMEVNAYQFTILSNELSKGTYIYNLILDKGNVNGKLVIE